MTDISDELPGSNAAVDFQRASLLLQHTPLLHLSYSCAPPTHAALVPHRQ